MLPSLLLGVFNFPVNMNLSPLLWLGVAGAVFALVFFVARNFAPGGAVTAVATAVPELMLIASRAANLLRHIDPLGLPFLAPLIKDASEGKWYKVPGDVLTIFDQLDDKATRAAILDTLEKARLKQRLADPADREALLKYLETQLGVTIPRA